MRNLAAGYRLHVRDLGKREEVGYRETIKLMFSIFIN